MAAMKRSFDPAVDLPHGAVQNKCQGFAACGRGKALTMKTDQGISGMPVRLRKFIGTILLIVLVLGYAFLATTIAVNALGNSPWWVHLSYFFLTGLLWILPAMLLIKWMAGPKRQ